MYQPPSITQHFKLTQCRITAHDADGMFRFAVVGGTRQDGDYGIIHKALMAGTPVDLTISISEGGKI